MAVRNENLGTMALALVAAGGAFVSQVILMLVLMVFAPGFSDSTWGTVVYEVVGAVVGIICFVRLGGKDYLLTRPSVQFDTFRFGWWSLLLTSVLGVIAFVEYIVDGYPFSETWPMDFMQIALLCLSIGFFEEIVFRGLLFNGLLSVFGGTKRGVVVCSIIVCAVFGMAHVDTSLDFDTPLMIGQAVLKAVQTGTWSILLIVCVLKNHDLTGPSLFHGLEDFLPSVGSIFFSEAFETNYVSDDAEDGLYTLLFYAAIIVLYLPFIIKSVKWLMHEAGPDLGAFVAAPALHAGAVAEVAVGGTSGEGFTRVIEVTEAPVPASRNGGQTPPPPTGWQ